MANNTIETRRPDKRPAPAEAQRREPRARVDAAPVRGRPANENDPGSSMMLAKLRRQPSYAPYYAAFLLSLTWIAGWFFTFSNTLTAANRNLPEIMQALALLALPLGIGWVVAYFLWRASQLRHVSEVLMQSAMRLIRPQDIATEGITTIAQAVRSEVDLLVGGVEHAVQRATALEEIVHKEIAAIERAFGGNEDRIRSLVTGIENQRTALLQAGLIINNDANPLLTRLETNTQHLDSVIGNAHAALGRLEKGMRETTVDLARTMDEVTGRASAAGEEILGQTSQLERTSNVMTGELREFSRHLAGQIDQLTHATGSLNTETSEFGRHVQGVEAALTQTVRQSIEQLTGIKHDIAHTVERASVSSVDQMKQTAANLTEVIQSAGSGISYHLKDTTADAIATLERAGTDTARQIDQSRLLVSQGLQTVTAEYLDNVAKSRAGLMDYLDGSSHNIAGAINQATEAIATNVNSASAQFLSGMDRTANNLISELNSTGSGLAGRVEQATGQLMGRFEGAVTTVTGNLDEATRRFQGLVGGTAEELEARIDSAAERLYGHMSATIDSVSGKIDEVTGTVHGRLEQTSGTIAAHLKETAEIVNRQMQDSGIALASNIENSGGIITEKLISVSGSFALNVTKTREELTELLIANTKMMTERLDTTASDMTNAFAETAVRVTSQVNEANSLMAERLVKTSTEVTSQLGATSTQIISEIGKASQAFSEGIGQSTQQITGRLEQDAGLLMERFGRAAKEFENTSANVSTHLGQTTLQITGRLEQDTGLLVERVDRAAKGLDSVSVNTAVMLDEAHRKFSRHVETANTYLADQLSTAASAIDERLEGISMNLTGKLEMTGSRVSERLEDVTGLVERSLGKFNEEMERVLINRKDALDLLIGDAARRADEVDAVMTSYMKLIENSLASSEARSKEIGRIVAEQTVAAAASLEQEIGRMEANSGGQIAHASQVLRDQHERAMAAMNEMLSATATDFQQTAQDMRITAQQVVKEIDGARTEMKRAIVGLPDETRSNADAMRRVVSDQISALNALAEVVKRQTGSLDLSGPGIALQRGFAPAKSESAAQAAQNGAAGGELRGRILSDLSQSTARIAEPARAAPARVAKSAPQSLPQDMESLIDKLNMAARDLVEAIDGSLPRDLEKRFAAGERGVYTSRLYEGRGKRLQKLLVERYGNDRMVRGRIDASIRLFEQLLETMSAASQGEAMLDACLASESGRIYVMLAEASGRLPPQ